MRDLLFVLEKNLLKQFHPAIFQCGPQLDSFDYPHFYKCFLTVEIYKDIVTRNVAIP